MALAVVIDGSDPPRVVALVREDVPLGWSAPPGCVVVPASQLPKGWQMDAASQPVPQEITPWQLQTWLLRARSITPAAVAGLIGTLPPHVRAQAEIDWQRAASVRRSHPLIDRLGAALGMTAAEIDQAFREAAELT